IGLANVALLGANVELPCDGVNVCAPVVESRLNTALPNESVTAVADCEPESVTVTPATPLPLALSTRARTCTDVRGSSSLRTPLLSTSILRKRPSPFGTARNVSSERAPAEFKSVCSEAGGSSKLSGRNVEPENKKLRGVPPYKPCTTRSQLFCCAWVISRLILLSTAPLERFVASTVTIKPIAGGVPVSRRSSISSIACRQLSAVAGSTWNKNCGAFIKLKSVSNVPSCVRPKPVICGDVAVR